MDIVEQKKELRKLIYGRKAQYTPQQLVQISIPILSVVESMEVFQKSNVIMAYWAMPDEVHTQLLIEKWAAAKKFYLPVVKKDHLEFRLFQGAASLEKRGKFHVEEPVGPLITNDIKVDLILVPGMAFTEAGDRIGRGKGYYDGFLKQYPDAYKLGLAFSFQMVDSIPLEPHDLRMDGVVSGS